MLNHNNIERGQLMETSGIEPEILEKLFDLIQDELGVDPREYDPNKNVILDLGLDSVQITQVSLRIDAEFGVDLPLSILDNFTLANVLAAFNKGMDKKRAV